MPTPDDETGDVPTPVPLGGFESMRLSIRGGRGWLLEVVSPHHDGGISFLMTKKATYSECFNLTAREAEVFWMLVRHGQGGGQ